MTAGYIEHVTLTTGHTRRSWRHEIAPDILPALRPLIEAAREPEHCVPVPGIEPRLALRIEDTRRCALVTVQLYDDHVPILTMAIAAHSRCGQQLWELLHETARLPLATDIDQCPPEPWCAVRLEHGAALLPREALMALGDFERCVAWAWMQMREEHD